MKKFLTLVVCALLVIPLSAQTWSKALEKSAKAGDVEAQFIVGNAYLKGDGVKQNRNKATKWLFMAAQAGQTDAIKALCTYYNDALEQVAAAGNAHAQFALANFYETGNGVAQNNETAIKWYGKAAVQGIQEAKPKILVVYNEALDTLAAAGDADAQFALANFYAKGNGVAQNTAVALDWYGAAAAQGNAEAKQKVLGSYSSGLVRLAKVGDIDAATQVADFLFNGAGGATKNEKEAAEYYGIAYKAGNATAGTKLITMYNAYLNGRGVVKNTELANIYLAAAALAGIQEAKDKFYSTMSPQLEQAAESGDPNAMLAIARLNYWGKDKYGDRNEKGLKWTLRAIEKGYIDEVLSAMKEEYKKAGYDERSSRFFGEFVNWGRYVFDNDPKYNGLYAFNFLKGWSQKGTTPYESAYYAALLFKEKYKLRGLKSLMNQYKHPKARKLYDDWYFQYDCTTYEIGRIDGIGSIEGFNEVSNKVLIDGVDLYDFEVPTSEELQKLLEFNPDFAINKDAVRVIRGFRPKDGSSLRWVLDIFILPGMVAYGPDSYLEILKYKTKAGPYSYNISLSNPYRIRFNKFADEDTKFSEKINLADTIVPEVVYESFGDSIKSIDTINAEYTIEFKDLELLKDYYDNVSEQSPRCYSVTDGIAIDLHAALGFSSKVYFHIDSYTVKGEDGSEYSLMTKEECKSIPEDVKPIGSPFYRMSYSKPDGSKMDVLIGNGHVDEMNFDYMKEHINAALLDSLFLAEEFSTVIAENGGMTRYRKGILGSKYDAQEEQRRKAENDAIWEAFWGDMAKQYGISQVNLLRNSKQQLVKGLDIRLLTHYTAFMYEKMKIHVGAMKFYRLDADGYGIYILYKLTGEEIVIRTRNYKIYDWTLYGSD